MRAKGTTTFNSRVQQTSGHRPEFGVGRDPTERVGYSSISLERVRAIRSASERLRRDSIGSLVRSNFDQHLVSKLREMKLSGLRALVGFAAAWATSVAVAFVVGCIYAVTLIHDHAGGLIKAAGSGQKDALSIFLFFGGTTAIAAAIAFLTILVIAWPIHLISRKWQRVSRSQYVAAGLAIAVVVGAVLLGLQFAFDPLAVDDEYYLEIVVILLGGPAAMLVFWSVARPDRLG